MHFLITGVGPTTKPTKKFLEGRIRNAGGTLIESVVDLEPFSTGGKADEVCTQEESDGEGTWEGQPTDTPQSQVTLPKHVVIIATPAAHRRIKVRATCFSRLLLLGHVWQPNAMLNDHISHVLQFMYLWQYLWGMASGSPVVHPDWVEECIAKDRVEPYTDYQLPSGFSMVQKRFVFQDTPVTDVFQGACVATREII